MKIKNKKILVYGLGKSGIETVKFLQTKKCQIYIYDDKNYQSIYNTKWLDTDYDLQNIDFVIISPGIGDTELYLKLQNLNITIYSELKFASYFIKGKIIAVTGTNGKTTTVNILYEILKKANISCCLCGNVGTPLISFVGSKVKYFICEVSSFQLENQGLFKPYISVLLNVQSDHLSRHKTFENYKNIKFSIFDNMKKNSLAILNENLKDQTLIQNSKLNNIFFSSCDKSNACLNDQIIVYKKYKINISEVKLSGLKNIENILACLIVCDKLRIKKEIVVETIKNFNGLKHRIEFVGSINGVKYINDSKATNPDSTCLALECFDNVILLLGGVDKGLNYNDIFKFQNIKYIICFGQAKEIIYKSAIDFGLTNICKCNNMADALHYAQKIAFENDIVLLSPACSSFDEFNSYEHRGDKFIELVKNDLGGFNEKNIKSF